MYTYGSFYAGGIDFTDTLDYVEIPFLEDRTFMVGANVAATARVAPIVLGGSFGLYGGGSGRHLDFGFYTTESIGAGRDEGVNLQLGYQTSNPSYLPGQSGYAEYGSTYFSGSASKVPLEIQPSLTAQEAALNGIDTIESYQGDYAMQYNIEVGRSRKAGLGGSVGSEWTQTWSVPEFFGWSMNALIDDGW